MTWQTLWFLKMHVWELCTLYTLYLCVFQHGTCPVCRKDLNGEDSSLKNDDSLLSEIENFRDSSRSDQGTEDSSSNPEWSLPNNVQQWLNFIAVIHIIKFTKISQCMNALDEMAPCLYDMWILVWYRGCVERWRVLCEIFVLSFYMHMQSLWS